jgi:mono/diheme cytochrome c family protein
MVRDEACTKHGRKVLEIAIVIAGAVVMTAAALDAAHGAEKPATQAAEREVIPGAERMTAAERDAYRRRMQNAATPEEKARIRAEFAMAAEKSAAPAVLVGDSKRGASLHGACFSCHGIERYTAPVTHATASFFDSLLRASGLSDLPPSEPKTFKGRIRSVDALRAAVMRRNEFFNPKLTPQEVEDVVAYLNETYYKFPHQTARAPGK